MTTQAILPVLPDLGAGLLGERAALLEDATGGKVFINGQLAYVWGPGQDGLRRLAALSLMAFSVQLGSAADLTWDPANAGNGGGIDPGDGPWDLTSLVWNNGAGNVAWTQSSTTSPLNNAVCGGGDGAYAVTVGATQVAASNVLFGASG